MNGFDGGKVFVYREPDFGSVGINTLDDKYGSGAVWLSLASARRLARMLQLAAREQKRKMAEGKLKKTWTGTDDE